MRNYWKRVLATVIVFVTCTFAMAVYAEPADIQGNWARTEINRWIDRGIFKGDANGNFKPDSAISRAEFAAVINRIFNYKDRSGIVFSDVKASDWFAADIDKAAAAGVLQGNGGKAMPNVPVTRQEAAVMLARAFCLEASDKNAVKGFNDAASIPSWSRDALNAMYEKKYISGQPGNVIAPAAKTSRAEAVKMLDNIVSEMKNKPGTYSGTVEGNLVVNTADAVLESMVIKGDLYLTQGIGDGSVTLNNVTVKGRTIVNGGGDHSVVIKNSTLSGSLYVYKKDGKVRILAQGSTDIPSVFMLSGGTLEESGITGNGFGDVQAATTIAQGQSLILNGIFDEVSVEAARIDVKVAGGSVNSLTVGANAAGSNITIAEGAAVSTLTMDGAVNIKGKGAVNTANLNVNGITMEQIPAVINGKTGVILPSNLEAALNGASGGAGGGGSTEETLKVVSASAYVGGSWIAAKEKSSGVWEVDLTGKDVKAMFTDLKVSASPDVVKADVVYLSIFSYSKNFTNGSAIVNIHSMMGAADTGEPGVSIQSIKDLGETEFTVSISDSNGKTKSVTIRLVV